MSPSTKRKNWSKEAMWRDVSGDTGYLRDSIYFSVAERNSGEVCEGQIPFCRGASKCAFRKKNCSTQ